MTDFTLTRAGSKHTAPIQILHSTTARNVSPLQDNTHTDDHILSTYCMRPGLKYVQ